MEELTASVIYAGVLLANRGKTSRETRLLETARIRVGPADECSFDYEGVESFISRFGPNFFPPRMDRRIAFRETLQNYVLGGGEGWPELLPVGRRVVVRQLSPNERQCFEIAGLLDGIDPDTIAWWDSCATIVRAKRTTGLANDGREAERLSFERELIHLDGSGVEPIWMALEDNSFGCDIQSFRPGTRGWANPRYHFIEVKSTIGRSIFYITQNEWRFASRHSDSWELQFWDMNALSMMTLSFQQLQVHIPQNRRSGEWMSAMISTEDFDAQKA